MAEGEGLERRDFSLQAWEGGHRPERLFSFWRTVVHAPHERRKILVDDDVLLDLFHRLAEDARAQREAFRFVLGLILMRKRLLRFDGRRQEGEREIWLMRPRGSAPELPAIPLVNPNLSDDDVRELSAQLGEILAGEF